MTYYDPEICHYVYLENGEAIFIPVCWGALYGEHKYCSCDIAGSKLDQAIEAKEYAEDLADQLRETLTYYRQQHSKLHMRLVESRSRNFELRRTAT
ncbi:MAG: hypothetical protein JKY94_09865 [Rhodobacteraceae bacterium]|nr:hypothetical protein [Paracoccaceae bacterium]